MQFLKNGAVQGAGDGLPGTFCVWTVKRLQGMGRGGSGREGLRGQVAMACQMQGRAAVLGLGMACFAQAEAGQP